MGGCGHAGAGSVAWSSADDAATGRGRSKRPALAYRIPVARSTGPSRHPMIRPHGASHRGAVDASDGGGVERPDTA